MKCSVGVRASQIKCRPRCFFSSALFEPFEVDKVHLCFAVVKIVQKKYLDFVPQRAPGRQINIFVLFCTTH